MQNYNRIYFMNTYYTLYAFVSVCTLKHFAKALEQFIVNQPGLNHLSLTLSLTLNPNSLKDKEHSHCGKEGTPGGTR